jgi:uncharacterized protein (TIGR02246 family)
MTRTRVCVALAAAATALAVLEAGQQKKEEPKKAAAVGAQAATKAPANQDADEAAIRANVQAFAAAYNGHNAKAIADLFAEQAKIVTEDGDVVDGRGEIQQVFDEIFADDPKTQIEVTVTAIRFIGADLAIETGSTKTTPAPGETPDYDRYTVLHIKRDGKWLMALARDTEGEPPTNHERLEEVAWLIGEWVDESPDSVVATTCRWSEDKNFILQDGIVQIAGNPAMKVSMRVGWDPLTKQIKSWVFDSEGGYGEGTWTRDGDRWVVKATGVRKDGTTASATTIYTPTGKESYIWQSTDRIAGGEMRPPLQVKVVRKPPQPK